MKIMIPLCARDLKDWLFWLLLLLFVLKRFLLYLFFVEERTELKPFVEFWLRFVLFLLLLMFIVLKFMFSFRFCLIVQMQRVWVGHNNSQDFVEEPYGDVS